ncbi:DUF6241 domain-containing protein [Heyndrickxia acidicola]|uniref:DUF6241 domain-containing protein n=1 Tax=Heyndrickxia acidicola TaxID=209389 RepID=A0ABU6MFD9_9BACI|nr:DUF6241 domain-containing protein [Heyndrickxia acidicola]MED1203009.1 DUF6241 domain-containing protein [Heyndrickxia acidicola]
MKKWMYGILSVLALAIIFATVYYGFIHNTNVDKAASFSNVKEKSKGLNKEKKPADLNGVEKALGINDQSSEQAVVEVMHEMTHQKVKADEKWGAVEMDQDNIDAVLSVLKSSDFTDKDQMLKIAENWKKGDFSNIVEDHNYFWKLQGGNVGKAYGKLSNKEEEAYIQKNFKDK